MGARTAATAECFRPVDDLAGNAANVLREYGDRGLGRRDWRARLGTASRRTVTAFSTTTTKRYRSA